MNFSLRKIIVAFAVLLSACGSLFAQLFDFVSERHDNYIALTMNDCEEKYIDGYVGWYRGKNITMVPFYFEDSEWSFKGMDGPYLLPDSNLWFLSCDFKKNFFTDTTVKLGCKVIRDNQPPEIGLDIKKPYVNSFYASNDDFDFSFCIGLDQSDFKNEAGSGVKSVSFELDGSKKIIPLELIGTNIPLHVESEGEHYFSIEACDMVGNFSHVSERIIIDKTCPEIFVSHNINRGKKWCNSNVEIECTAVDMLSGVNESSWSCTSIESVSGKRNVCSDSALRLMEDGLHSLSFSVEDNCGNKTTTNIIEVCIDRTNPSIVLPESVVSSKYLLSDEMILDAEDNLSGVDLDRTIIELDERRIEPGKKISGLTNGWHEISADIYDKAGNKSDLDSISFFVDTIPPVIEEMPLHTNINTLRVECHDNESGIDVQKIFHKTEETNEWESGEIVELTEGYNSVFWMVYDKAGNSQSYSSKILVDTHGPEISYELNEYCNDSYISLGKFNVLDEYSDRLEISYSFDEGVIRKFSESFLLDSCIDLNGIRDGMHSICVYACDDHGNESKVKKSFILDRVSPEIKSINFRSHGKQISNGDRILWSTKTGVDYLSLEISVEGSDECSGVKNYCVELNGKKYEFSDFDFELRDFEDGINNIIVYCLDKAGNTSSSEKFWFYADKTKPNAPEILSTSFRYTTEFNSADNMNSGQFIVRPINQADCFVTGISYSLYLLSNSTGKKYLFRDVYLENNGDIKIDFKNLDDNLENQMYCLSCSSVGENNLKSDESVYCFRVDTSAPDEFSVKLKNAAGNENWINTDNPYLTWKVGFDATGFDRIVYCTMEKNSDVSVLENVEFNRVPLAKTEGAFRLFVPFKDTKAFFRAYDKVGNYIQKEIELKIDLVSPGFVSDEFRCKWANEKNTGKNDNLKVVWPKSFDNDSGVDYIKITVSSSDDYDKCFRKEYLYNRNKTECTIKNIDENKNYLIEITVYDKSGNYASKQVFCKSKNNESDFMEFRLSEIFGDVTFEADAVYSFFENSYSVRNGFFTPKHDLFYLDDVKTDFFDCDAFSLLYAENGLQSCSSIAGSYSFTIDDTVFSFNKIIADRNDGLCFDKLSCHQAFLVNECVIDSALEFDSSGINDFMLNTGKVFLEKKCVKFSSCILSNVTFVSIQDSKKKYGDNTYIRFLEESKIVPHDETLEIMCRDATSTLSDKEFYCQIISGSCDLVVSKDLRLSIVESYVENNSMEVQKSDFKVFDDHKRCVRIVVGNYSINLDTGKISSTGLKTVFYDDMTGAEIASIMIDGFEVKHDDIYFNESDALSCKSKFYCIYGNLNLTNIEITGSGLKFQSAIFPGFCFIVHGINGFCSKSTLVKNGDKTVIKVIDGYLNVFSGRFQIPGFLIDPNSNGSFVSNYKTGQINEKIYCGNFGSYVTVVELSITDEHVYADMVVPLSKSSNGILFESVVVDDEKVFCAKSNQNVAWNCFDLACEKILFDGNEITLQRGLINLSSNDHVVFSRNQIEFNKLVLNYDDVVYYEWAESKVGLNVDIDGFDLEVAELKISADGLDAELSGFMSFEKLQVSFSLKNICFDGKSDISSCGDLSGESMCHAVMSGHVINLPDCSLLLKNEKYVLCCNFPYFLAWDNNDDSVSIELGKITVDAWGNIENAVHDLDCVLADSNGIELHAKSVEILNNDIFFSGSIFVESINLCAEVTSSSIRYNYDGSFNLCQKINNVGFMLNGWNVSGHISEFESELICFENCEVEYFDEKIPVGNIRLDNTYAVQEDIVAYLDFELTMFGRKQIVSKTIFSRNGLYADIHIYFPSYISRKGILFENVLLKPDGDIFCDKIYDEYFFENERLNIHGKNLSLSNAGINVSQLELNSESSMNIGLTFYDVLMHGDCVEVNNFRSKELFLFNSVFVFNKANLDESGISFSGKMILSENCPGLLSKRTIELKSFCFSWNGEITEIYAVSNVNILIPLMEDWMFSCREISFTSNMKKTCIGFGEVLLKFPPSFFIGSVSVEGLTYDLSENRFDFGSISGTLDSDFSVFGLIFKLSKLYIDCNFNIGFEGSCVFVNENFPQFLRNASSSDAKIIFDSSGKLIELRVSVEGLNGNVLPGVHYLDVDNGSVCLSYDNDSILAEMKGDLVFNENASECLLGVRLSINSFKFDLKTMSLLNLDATLNKDSLNIYGIEFCDLSSSISWNSANEKTVSFKGFMIMPSSLPSGIAGKKFSIKEFVVDIDGKISSLSISETLDGEYDLFDAISVSDCLIDVSYSDKENLLVGLGCEMTLKKDKFPSGIGGVSTRMNIYFDSSSLLSFGGELDIPDCSLFGFFETKQISSKILKQDDSWIIDLHGGICFLPNGNIPHELLSSSLIIRSFKISTSGNVVDFDISGSCGSFTMFDSVLIDSPDFNVTNSSSDFHVSFSGSCTITSSMLPAVFSGLHVNLKSLVFSTSKGLLEFDCQLNNSICFDVLGRLELVVESISLSNSGLYFSSIAKMKFPGIMENVELRINEFAFDWNGKIKGIDGGLGYCCIDIGGFSGTIDNLQFKKDQLSEDGYIISLDNCLLRLPENMGGFFVAINNSYFRNGKFHGEFLIPLISCDIAGFKITLSGSKLNLDKKTIDFDAAVLTCPDILNFASISLFGVTVTSSHGLKFDGASIKLPDFKVGEIGFSRIQASFMISGKSFYIQGGGKAIIPNAGEIDAALSFTEKNKEHPIGLERAYFSFEVSMVNRGIPIGVTGLYFTGIRGGLAYGKPNEVPLPSKLFFGEGIRMQLGVSVKDFTGGKIVEIKPDLWIDIRDLTFAMQGQMSVLKGIFDIKANSACVLSKFGLYANMSFSIFIVKGEVSFFIFNGYDGVKFTGKTDFSVGIPKGFIVSWTLNLLFKKIHFCIPTHDCWPFSINAEFGDFANGKRGFKTSIDFPVVGDIGIFVSSAFGLHAGRLSSYDLLNPLGNGLFNFSSSSLLFENDVLSSFSESGGDVYESNEVFFERNEKSKRLIVVCAALEGEPELVVVSPCGRKFSSTSETVNAWYSENLCALSIDSEETGIWSFHIENAEPDMCSVKILEVGSRDRINDLSAIVDNNVLNVSGEASVSNANVAVSAENDEGFTTFLGNVLTDSNGAFSSSFNTNLLHEGYHEVFAEIVYPDTYEFSERKKSKEKIYISKKNVELVSVNNLRLFEDKEFISITCRWNNPNYANAVGFIFEYEIMDGQIHRFNIGNVNEYTLYGFNLENLNSVKVIPYDVNNTLGPENVVFVKDYYKGTGDFNITVQENLRITQNSFASLSVEINAVSNESEKMNYYTGKCITDIPGVAVVLENDAKTENGSSVLNFSFYVDRCVPEGSYEIELFIWNEKSYEKGKSIMVNVIVEKEKLELVRAFPNEISSGEKSRVRVYSRGHGLDSRYFFDGKEVVPGIDAEDENILVFDLISNDSGIISLNAENSNGDKSEVQLNVVKPTYEIIKRLKSITMSPGSFSIFPLQIVRHEGHENKVELKESLVQRNLFTLDYLSTTGDLIEVRISCSENAEPGEYSITLISDNGQIIELPVEVRLEQNKVPEIHQIIPYSCFEGDRICVYGNCFDDKTIVKFCDFDIVPEIISGNKIEFIVPEGASTGVLYVINGKFESNRTKLIVKKRSVSIKVDCRNIVLDSYGMVCISGSIQGPYELVKNARISFDHNVVDLDVDIRRESLNQFDVCIAPGNKTRNGRYVLDLICEARKYTETISIVVNVNCALSIEGEFADGYVGKYYSQCLICNNSAGNEVFSCDIDPKTGLRMSSSGILSGVPLRSGSITFFVTCVDELNHYVCEKKSINILQSSWTHEKMSSRSNRFVSSDLPSNVGKIISSDVEFEISYILGKDKRVVCVGKNNITVLSDDLKKKIWNKEFESEISCARIIGDQVYVRLLDHCLVMYSLSSGNETMSWNEVDSFSCNERYLVLWCEEIMKVYDVQNYCISRILSDCISVPDETVWCGNELYGIIENSVYSILNDSGKKFSCDSRILFSVSQDDYLYLVTKNFVYRLDQNLQSFCKAKILLDRIIEICVDENYLFVVHSKGYIKLLSDTLEFVSDYFDDRIDITSIVLGNEKAVVLQDDEINVCLKSLIGKKKIWSHKVNSCFICCFVDNTIYFSDGHKIISIKGEGNIYEPEIEFTVPDNFIFNSCQPENFIYAVDEDSENVTVYVSVNLDEFKPHAEIVLSEGRNHIEAYGVDSKGLAGPVNSIDIYCNVSSVED